MRKTFLALALALAACARANPDFLSDDVQADAAQEGHPGEVTPADTPPAPPPDLGSDRPVPADAQLADAQVAAGPILHWRFDEQGGTVAVDSSGSGVNGSYLGEPTLPRPLTAVPPTTFANPRSLEFPGTGRPSVRAAGARAALRLQPTDEVTLSVWYRATAASASYGGDLINVADALLIRLKPNHIEVGRRRDLAAQPTYTLAENDQITSALDGRWHHVAGVIAAQTVTLFFDGVALATGNEPRPIAFPGADVVVGRRDQASAAQQFQGAIDDVRIYRRALSEQEVRGLAQGGP